MEKAHLHEVAEFHRSFDIPIEQEPGLAHKTRYLLRATLIREEAAEAAEALEGDDLPHIAKELADLYIVLQGTVLELGLQGVMDEVITRVHQSNMSKLGNDGKPVHRADGKVIKGPNYREPDLSDLFG